VKSIFYLEFISCKSFTEKSGIATAKYFPFDMSLEDSETESLNDTMTLVGSCQTCAGGNRFG
jgi:hypothetical protein